MHYERFLTPARSGMLGLWLVPCCHLDLACPPGKSRCDRGREVLGGAKGAASSDVRMNERVGKIPTPNC